ARPRLCRVRPGSGHPDVGAAGLVHGGHPPVPDHRPAPAVARHLGGGCDGGGEPDPEPRAGAALLDPRLLGRDRGERMAGVRAAVRDVPAHRSGPRHRRGGVAPAGRGRRARRRPGGALVACAARHRRARAGRSLVDGGLRAGAGGARGDRSRGPRDRAWTAPRRGAAQPSRDGLGGSGARRGAGDRPGVNHRLTDLAPGCFLPPHLLAVGGPARPRLVARRPSSATELGPFLVPHGCSAEPSVPSLETGVRFASLLLGSVFFVGLAAAWGPGAQAAGTYYVDGANPLASDANPGTIGAPFRTITAALAKGGPGVTLLIGPAVYREQVTVGFSGAAGNPLVVRALAPGVRIEGSDDFSSPAAWTPVSGNVWLAANVSWSPAQVFLDGARLAVSSAAVASLPPNSFRYVSGSGLYVNAGGASPGTHA